MKKILSVILALTALFSCAVLASCGEKENDVPSGMKLASADTVPYLFYVPAAWQSDVASGASTAYYSDSDGSNVSVMTFSCKNSDATVEDWWTDYTADFERVYEDFEVVSREEATLDGVKGEKVVFTGAISHDDVKETLKFMQVSAIRSKTLSAPEVYVITYTSTPEVFDSHLDDVAKIIENFKFN